MTDVSKVTRVEVIDSAGRRYVNRDPKLKVELSLQDQGRTLKVFVDGPEPGAFERAIFNERNEGRD